MLAAQGVSWKRKLAFVGVTIIAMVIVYAVAVTAGLSETVNSVTDTSGATDPQVAAIIAMKVLFLAVPFAILAVFVGRRPSVLWIARSASKAIPGTPATR